MTNSTKTVKKNTEDKDKVEEVMTSRGLFYRIYKKGKFVEMLTEEEFKALKK
jgi:alpha-acetolactate decarboxylase